MVLRESADLTPRTSRSRYYRTGRLGHLNAFSLVTLISNILLGLIALIFYLTDSSYYLYVYYYLYVAINSACLFLWFFRGQRLEDFLALSMMFITIYILLPAPLNAASHFVFWGSPEIYASLSTGAPYLCAIFLAAASVPTLVGLHTPRKISAQKFKLNWGALLLCTILLCVYMVVNYSLFFSSRIELELAAAEADVRPLTGFVMHVAPRGVGLAVFLCLVTYVIGHLKARLPLLDISLLAPCLFICLIYFNPLTLPRQMTMAFGLSTFYYLSWFGILNRRWLVLIIPIAAFLVGPAVSNITRFELTADFFPVSPDFDCFQNMNVGIEVIKTDGLKWGGNILASLSFFLPSELKFFSSYHLLSSPYFVDLLLASNISMPLPVDLYADFGTFGLIAETILVFWYLRFAFGRIETSKTESQRIYRVGAISIILGCWPAIMRGPLLGNSPVLLIFLIGWFLVCRLLDATRTWGLRLSKVQY
jgi:hypothetical protein